MDEDGKRSRWEDNAILIQSMLPKSLLTSILRCFVASPMSMAQRASQAAGCGGSGDIQPRRLELACRGVNSVDGYQPWRRRDSGCPFSVAEANFIATVSPFLLGCVGEYEL